MSVNNLVPTFNTDSYRNGIIPPTLGWVIVQVLSLILTFINSDGPLGVFASGGFSIEVHLLFGAWAGLSVANSGGNSGDGIVAGLILGLVGWLLWFILFGTIDPADAFANADFADDFLPQLWFWMITHSIGSVTIAGIMGDSS